MNKTFMSDLLGRPGYWRLKASTKHDAPLDSKKCRRGKKNMLFEAARGLTGQQALQPGRRGTIDD